MIGGKGLCDGFDGQKLQAPVLYNEEPLILQAILFNLGAKDAGMPQTELETIPATDSHVVSFTAYADEIDSDTWSLILQAPVKNTMRILLPDQADLNFLSSPWGRSYHKPGKRVEPKNSTSIQFHARVLKSDLRMLLRLRASGTSGVYTTPKSEDRQVLPDFQVVWLQQLQVELAVSLSRCDSHCGTVGGQKSDGRNRGIRFVKQDTAAAYAILKPNFPFKVAPTPTGQILSRYKHGLEFKVLNRSEHFPVRYGFAVQRTDLMTLSCSGMNLQF